MASLLKIIANIECDLYLDHEFIEHLYQDKLYKINIRKGTYILEFKVDNLLLHGEEYCVSSNDEDLLYRLNHSLDTSHSIIEYSGTSKIELKESIINAIVSHTFNDGIGVIEFKNKLHTIEDYMFDEQHDLYSIVIPNGVTHIGKDAFGECANLKKVVLPDTLNEIGECAFIACKSLKEINLPVGLKAIHKGAFYGCQSLESISIPYTVDTLGDFSFCGCHALECIIIPDNVTQVGSNICGDCNLTIDGKFCSEDHKCLIVNGSLNSYCSTDETYIIPNTVIKIGVSAFAGCKILKKLIIPEGVKSLDVSAFEGCTSLVEIQFPKSLVEIGKSAFENCSSLEEIYLPENVSNIGESCFSGCTNLNKVYLPDGVKIIENRSFSGCSKLSMIKLPSKLTTIGNSAFYGCSALKGVIIPDATSFIGHDAFNGCTTLKHVCMPTNSKVRVGFAHFLGTRAFYNCNNLEDITIVESVTEILENAFDKCHKLKTINCKSSIPPKLKGQLTSLTGTIEKIYVPCGSGDAYKNADFWTEYKSLIFEKDFNNTIDLDSFRKIALESNWRTHKSNNTVMPSDNRRRTYTINYTEWNGLKKVYRTMASSKEEAVENFRNAGVQFGAHINSIL
jgi:hypothetical protein